jgi:serine/threonine protein kinase
MQQCKECGYLNQPFVKLCKMCNNNLHDNTPSATNAAGQYEIQRADLLFVNNKSAVISIDFQTVGKTIISNSKKVLEVEAEKIKYANEVNELSVKFIGFDIVNGQNIMLLERIFPLQISALSNKEKSVMFELFFSNMTDLHSNGLVHNDINTTMSHSGSNSNFVFTTAGIRLLDFENSMLLEDVGEMAFNRMVEQELKAINQIKNYSKI